ncbi:hypothetical protein A8M32_09290 [Sinorhizobium alkalisoli]|uniref:Uncharacterized protein n=1 Tax=Sinorhizobium alkalisoli TaxID=1752398 RepID=A0A1E3VDG9_9HYPH|nr:hypothetical protein A8M32_09290 [Sinorhizobium alkalisoli]
MAPGDATVFAAHLMAFERATEGKAHRAPWRAARGGFSYDIEVELVVLDQLCSQRQWGFPRITMGTRLMLICAKGSAVSHQRQRRANIIIATIAHNKPKT